LRVFRPIEGGHCLNAPYRTERDSMPGEIFDQDRPPRRSAMARRLDEAFAGCENWTLAPPSQRRSEPAFSPREPGSSRMIGRVAGVRAQEPGAL